MSLYEYEKQKHQQAKADLLSEGPAEHVQKAARVPIGERRSIDEIQLERVVVRPIEIKESFLNGWRVVKSNPGKTVGLYFLGTMIFFAAYIIFLFTALYSVAGVSWLLGLELDSMWTFYGLTFFFTSFTWGLGFSFYVPILLRAIRKQPIRVVVNFFDLKYLWWKIITTSFLFSIVLMLCSITVLAGIMFAFAGLFSYVMVVDKNIAGIGAMTASWRMIKNNKGDLGMFFLAALLVNTPGAAFWPLLYVSVPVTLVAFLTIYDSIVEPGNAYIVSRKDSVDASIFS